MLAVVAAVVLAIVHIHFALFNNCNSPNSACTLGPCTWFLLDIGLRARISRRGLVAYRLAYRLAYNITFCVIIKFHDLPESDLRYTTISSHHVLRRKYFKSRFAL